MHYHGHRQRLRARLKDAPEKLADYEILELLLGHVLLRCDTKPIAKELMERFGNMRAFLDARPDEYLDIPGVGPSVVSFTELLREFFARYAESRVRSKEILCSPEAVSSMAKQRLGRLAHEEVWVAYVDTRNRMIAWEKAAKGTINSSSIHPRDIMERALALKASGFIVVHNHPGGNSSPSSADIDFTRQLERAAQTLFIRFLDHIIVSDTECYSIISNAFIGQIPMQKSG